MSISVRYFASLRENLKKDSDTLDAGQASSVAEVWQCVNKDVALPQDLLCAVNHRHASFDTPVQEGDEVAFFPPVTGG